MKTSAEKKGDVYQTCWGLNKMATSYKNIFLKYDCQIDS